MGGLPLLNNANRDSILEQRQCCDETGRASPNLGAVKIMINKEQKNAARTAKDRVREGVTHN